MELIKIRQIKRELERFNERVLAAEQRALNNKTGYSVERGYNEIPEEKRSCFVSREASALKRGALDLKRILSNL